MKEEIIEWKMIRPDGSERVLHIGKNEVNSRELDFLSNNSLIRNLFQSKFEALSTILWLRPPPIKFRKNRRKFKAYIYR